MAALTGPEIPRLADTCRPSTFWRSPSDVTTPLPSGVAAPFEFLIGLWESNCPPVAMVGSFGLVNRGWLNWMPSGVTRSG
jgi:hypothetical protein